MSRQVLDDGRWFDPLKSQWWEEDTRWNGNNHISKATGSQWDHEKLYRTKGGIYILHHWSQWQGSTEQWVEIDEEAAARWLVCNGHEPPKALAQQCAALEVQ